jgi:hypothetical protein
MDVMRARVVLRERGMLDVADLALRFVVAHARVYAALYAAVILPGIAATCAAGWIIGWWAGWMTAVVGAAFGGVPFVVLASRLVFADRASPREAIRTSVRALPGIAAIRSLQGLALLLCAPLVLLPWLGVGGATLFVVEVRLLEDITKPTAVFGRASRIAWARFGTTIAAVIILSSAPFAAASLADFAGREVLSQGLELPPPPSMFTVGGSWLAFVGWWAALPFLATARFLLYLDFRTRTEGWDIQTRFAALAGRRARVDVPRAPSWRPKAATLLALAIGALSLVPRDVLALGTPGRAAADVAEAMSSGDDAFCREPAEPLSARDRRLCKHAGTIPRCGGFAAACDRAERVRDFRPWSEAWAEWLARVAQVLAGVARAAIWTLVAAVAVAAMLPVLRAIGRRRRAAPAGPTEPAPATATRVDTERPDAETLLARADEHARRGEANDAMELYLAAGLRALQERGAIRLTRDLTNGECVRACADTTARPALAILANDVDGIQFGGQPPDPERLSRAARTATSLVRGAAALVTLLVCAGTCGCNDFELPGRHRAHNPSGRELWIDVMTRQGWEVTPLGRSMSSLPAPEPGSNPVVVVDANQVEIDEGTGEHLRAWVEGGGTVVLAGSAEPWPAPLRPQSWTRHGSGRISVPFESGFEYADLADGWSMEGLPAEARAIGSFEDGGIYATWMPYGHGYVMSLASDELMTNAALASGSNASAMVALFAHTEAEELWVAGEGDGVGPPSSPLAALLRAGLGLALVHALVATLLLFAAFGVRLTRAKPSPPPPSRPFSDHVEAVGALYARSRAAPVALAAYARFAEDRLRARNPRRAGDVAALLAAHAGLPSDVSVQLWSRADASKSAAPDAARGAGDDLAVLEDLVAAYSATTVEGT